MNKTATVLYRHFDGAGNLLYVGISLEPLRRIAQHASRSHWYFSISRVEMQWFPSRPAAEAAEKTAIVEERPAHNIRHAGEEPARKPPQVPVREPAIFSLSVFPAWFDNEVRCRGESLCPVLWQGEQWAVTTYGLECRDGTYAIEASRLYQDEDKGYGWSRHMAEKCWVLMDDFDEALEIARVLYPRGTKQRAAA